MPEVVVYTRRGCKLCSAAERIAERVTAGRADLVVVDIDADPDLYERYTVRVPVIVVDGREVAELQVHEDALRAALDGRPSSGTGTRASGDDRRGGADVRRGRLPPLRWRRKRRRTPHA